ncbi:MFS transporter [Streptomyces sp. NPDC046887]|uniref:MFS transporter n=1 Tax=Streptomyces sp. NPDC046887 TaxID=3155472 RepID=UPI0033C41771
MVAWGRVRTGWKVPAGAVLVALMAASSGPTPLWGYYRREFGLSGLDVTVVFGVYALALLGALLAVGRWSGRWGRRGILVGALVVAAGAMGLLAMADGLGWLVVGRVVQGLATGVGVSTAGAVLVARRGREGKRRAALVNALAPVLGMGGGVLLAVLLVRFGPAPEVVVYAVPGVVFAVLAVVVWGAGEVIPVGEQGERVTAAGTGRGVLVRAGGAVAAVWALGGFYPSLGPALVRVVAPGLPEVLGGMAFFALTAAAAVTVWVVRRMRPEVAAMIGAVGVLPSVALTLAALYGGGAAALFGGAVLAGVAFGAASQGVLRMVTGLAVRERAAGLAAYQVLAYGAMSVPVIAAGAASEVWGLGRTAQVYAGVAALLALGAVAGLRASGRKGGGGSDGAVNLARA